MNRQQVLETCPMPSQNVVMKYLLMIFALIFIGCSKYPIIKINCSIQSLGGGPELDHSFAFLDSDLFEEAEVQIFDQYPNTYKCGAYFQNESSISCQFARTVTGQYQSHDIKYNKLKKNISHQISFEDVDDKQIRMIEFYGSCEDA